MRGKIKTRQGAPYIWFAFILGILVVGFAITILQKPVSFVYNKIYNASEIDSNDDYSNFLTRSKTIWFWAPLIFAICLVLWLYANLRKKQNAS